MAYPYKNIEEEDISYICSILSPDRVVRKDQIAYEYYHDEMPIYGIYPPDLYVEVISTEEISNLVKYCNQKNIPQLLQML